MTISIIRRYARYALLVASLLLRPDASCRAAMAEAAVTPPPAEPLLTSVLPVTHLSSSILLARMSR